jgi:hypothetical protein
MHFSDREAVCGGASFARKGDQRRAQSLDLLQFSKMMEELKLYVELWNGSRELALAAAN